MTIIILAMYKLLSKAKKLENMKVIDVKGHDEKGW
jgi:hypothetical protein